MQGLVYTFIAVSAAAAGAAAYFGLAFTPAQAILAALVFGCIAVTAHERVLRQRAEQRLERAIEELSRLLSTDAKAGAVLGQRINAMADLNAGPRLGAVEADISVLGTVIRQVAEAVADIEERAAQPQAAPAALRPAPAATIVPPPREPTIPLETVRRAFGEGRLLFHVQPVVTLPQRRPTGFDLVPRLALEAGALAEPADFLPRQGGADVLRQLESIGLLEAITLARRARTAGQRPNLFVPLSRATLGDGQAAEGLIASLEANRPVAPSLIFAIEEAEWLSLTTAERAVTDAVHKKGSGYSLLAVQSLRLDVGELAARGVRSLRIDAARFLHAPESLTDFHAADIADYLARFGVTLLASGVSAEAQIPELIDHRITLVQGPHLGAAAPLRGDLLLDGGRQPAPALHRVEG
ncbi:EAL domain-containing protein [Devosia sp. 1566]|uniref:EAL domain-containing protein n=1 Tax=Devosia sp. 1566 TaxID=2499144 RepID=UPI000FD836DE|nr:EAL domain-containing protein [Devosia sp. 1566]